MLVQGRLGGHLLDAPSLTARKQFLNPAEKCLHRERLNQNVHPRVETAVADHRVGLAAAEPLAAFLGLAVEDNIAVSAQTALPVLADHLRALVDDALGMLDWAI